jgi:ankyrin repeat protein
MTWDNGKGLDLRPIPFIPEALESQVDQVKLKFTVQHITPAEDYEIFNAWRAGNHSLVFDLIADHKGINAVDEWGQTMLMHAIQNGNQPIVASLLNTRMPKVDVNLAKSVSASFG